MHFFFFSIPHISEITEDNIVWKSTDIGSFELKSDSEVLENEHEHVFFFYAQG